MTQEMFNRKHSWIVCFICLFLLSQFNPLGIRGKPELVFGLPDWLYWFLFVHLLFIVAIYFMTKALHQDP
jgi:hypothetical protein